MPYELVKIQPKTNTIYLIFIVIGFGLFYLYKNKMINKSSIMFRSRSSEYFNENIDGKPTVSTPKVSASKVSASRVSASKVSASKVSASRVSTLKVKKQRKSKVKKERKSKLDPRGKIKEAKRSKNIDPYNSYNLGVCSKNCCATQWPVPIDVTENSNVRRGQLNKRYRTSNLTCNNGVMNTGCVCLTKESGKLLGNRGYVDYLPLGNGILEQDNRTSAFKLLEDQIPRPLNVIGQTEELIGSKNQKIKIKGNDENKYDKKIDRYRTVNDDMALAKRYSMPIDNNMIFFDNQAINNAITNNNMRGNSMTPTDRLLLNPLGVDVKDIKVNRK